MDKVLLPILLIVTAIGLFFSYTSPAYDALQALETQKGRLDDVLQRSDELENSRNDLLDTYASITQNDSDRLNIILPERIDVVRSVIELDALARQRGVTVTAYGIPEIDTTVAPASAASTKKDGPERGSADFSIECTGPYESFVGFTQAVERLLDVRDIVGLEVAAASAVELRQGTLETIYPTYKLKIRGYWLK